jgi:hypothetical protein
VLMLVQRMVRAGAAMSWWDLMAWRGQEAWLVMEQRHPRMVLLSPRKILCSRTPRPSFLQGGNAGLTNNNAVIRAAGGGSPGYYSGSAGLSLGSTTSGEAAGGSGVGYVNRTNELYVDGFVETANDGSSYQPPAQDVRGYVAGWGVADQSIATTELPVTPRRSGQGGGVVSW